MPSRSPIARRSPRPTSSDRRGAANPGPLAPAPWRPTRDQLESARAGVLSDVVAPDLRVLFCGINPSLYSTAVGHHFARPGNRFWPTLYRAGLTPRLFSPFEDRELLALGFGLTNIAPRTTASADELEPDEIRAGGRALRRKVLRLRPRFLAVVGFTSFRVAFDRPAARGGLQPDPIGSTQVWLLPNPSGLNAHHSPAELVALFRSLRLAAS